MLFSLMLTKPKLMRTKIFTPDRLFNIFLIFLLVGGVTACTSTQKLINSGHYDDAINRSVKKLRKNKNKEKQILFLKEAYEKALQRDMDRISFLKKEGNPDNSLEIYNLYASIKERQEMIRPLLPLYAGDEEIHFEFVNVDNEIIAWKKEAAGYLYSHAMQLLDKNDKYSARQAYDELMEAKNIFPNYRDIDQQLDRAFNMGVNWVKLTVKNSSPNLIPKEFAEEIYKTNLAGIEGKWFRFANFPELDDYDYVVRINLNFVDVGPEQVREKEYDQSKEIIDHYEYQKDEKGNYVLDSLGKKIKIPVKKVVTCHVIETHQMKAATLKGHIEYVRLWDNKIVHSEPFDINAGFDHYSASAQGNKKALDNETLKLLQNNPLPFPADYEMIMDGARRLQSIIQHSVQKNLDVLES